MDETGWRKCDDWITRRPTDRPFIIAEVGSNYLSLQDCMESISMAKQCGADAVKFQFFSSYDLYGHGSIEPGLNREWLPLLKEKADNCGIEWMCTAFSPTGIKEINPFVKRHKLASAEINHQGMLWVLRETKKPCLISTGGASRSDILSTTNILGRDKVTLLYCRANYPAKNVDLRGIKQLREEFDLPVGYSCHTTEWTTPLFACLHYQACVIEKHFKIREMNTPDNPHSLDPVDFQRMVKAIRNPESRVPMPDPSEKEFCEKHKRQPINGDWLRPS